MIHNTISRIKTMNYASHVGGFRVKPFGQSSTTCKKIKDQNIIVKKFKNKKLHNMIDRHAKHMSHLVKNQ